jgi:trimeric autotransporter adhesin
LDSGVEGDVPISPDGRYIAYQFTPNDGGTRDLYFTDSCLGAAAGCTPTTSAIALNDSDGAKLYPGPLSMTPDGRYIAFDSLSSDLVPLDTNGRDVFLADTCAGAPAGCSRSITRLSVNADGVQGDGYSGQPHISADGRWVVFTSSSTDLVTGVSVSDSNATNVFRVRTPVP